MPEGEAGSWRGKGAARNRGAAFLVMKVPGLLREASVVHASGGTRRPLQEKVVLQKWTKFCHGAAKIEGLPWMRRPWEERVNAGRVRPLTEGTC